MVQENGMGGNNKQGSWKAKDKKKKNKLWVVHIFTFVLEPIPRTKKKMSEGLLNTPLFPVFTRIPYQSIGRATMPSGSYSFTPHASSRKLNRDLQVRSSCVYYLVPEKFTRGNDYNKCRDAFFFFFNCC